MVPAGDCRGPPAGDGSGLAGGSFPEGGAGRGRAVAQGRGQRPRPDQASASGSGARRRRSGPPWRVVAREAFEARKAQLKGDGKAGRWFSPARAARAAEARDGCRSRILTRTTSGPRSRRSGTRRARRPARRSRGFKVVLKHAVAMGLTVDLQATDKARVLLGKSRQKTEHIAAAARGRRFPRSMPR